VRLALPDDPEVAGLLALMLLTEARRPARTDTSGRARLREAGKEIA
jgi:predicted RNA polymerase sigma factor